MMNVLTDGERVEALVQRALDRNPQINLTGISGDAGDGSQPFGFAAKQLLVARNGREGVSRQKLEAIAKRLGDLLGEPIEIEDLIRRREDSKKQDGPLGPNTQTVSVEGNESDGIAAAPGSTVSIIRQIYKPD